VTYYSEPLVEIPLDCKKRCSEGKFKEILCVMPIEERCDDEREIN
jgi:hypothetical protein